MMGKINSPGRIDLTTNRTRVFSIRLLRIYVFIYLLLRCMECSRGIAMGILSVHPSVRLSVKRVHCDKTEESYV